MKQIELITTVANLFSFKTMTDACGNEYVVYENSVCSSVDDIEDKTAFEALENHVHLLDHITKQQLPTLIPVAKNLGSALLASLVYKYPSKKFWVYASLRVGDSFILRFHQAWPGEEPYCNASDFTGPKDFVFAFQN